MDGSALLVINDDYSPLLLKLLENAKARVEVLAFSFSIGNLRPSGRPGGPSFSQINAAFTVARKLVELGKRKVEIRLYIEGKRETSERNRATAAYLKKAGIKVKYGSTHAKGFLVDGRYLLFGSTNLTNQSILKNNETNLLLDQPRAALGFSRYFEHLWNGGHHGEIVLPLPMIADGGFKPALVEMIDAARATIDFSIYFFHYTEIEEALVRAAKRKVKITGFIHDHKSFALSYVRRTRGTAERLVSLGIKGLYFGPPDLFTHSKFLVRDRQELLLGTGNWLHEDEKVHPQLYIRLADARLSANLSRHLKAQIADQGTPVKPVRMRGRLALHDRRRLTTPLLR